MEKEPILIVLVALGLAGLIFGSFAYNNLTERPGFDELCNKLGFITQGHPMTIPTCYDETQDTIREVELKKVNGLWKEVIQSSLSKEGDNE